MKQPITSGNTKGVHYESLTHLHEARAELLEFELKKYNIYRRSIDLLPMSHADFLSHRYGLSLHEYQNKPLSDRERLLFYKLRSKYFNNVIIG